MFFTTESALQPEEEPGFLHRADFILTSAGFLLLNARCFASRLSLLLQGRFGEKAKQVISRFPVLISMWNFMFDSFDFKILDVGQEHKGLSNRRFQHKTFLCGRLFAESLLSG